MRNRYVIQVLLATFGFGLLLAVVAVLETPADRPPRATEAPRAPAKVQQCSASEAPAHAPMTTPRTDDFKAECEFPAYRCDD